MCRTHILLCATLLLSRCTVSGGQDLSNGQPGNQGAAGKTLQSTGTYTEGKDYIVLERVRFMDEQGFQQPAEAFSVLLPKGWKHEGGIHWKGLNECRGELVTASWKASSPDGAIRVVSLPAHSWGWASDPMMQQSMMMGAQNGGCETGLPIQAEQYFREVFAQRELQGASITEVKDNPAAVRLMDEKSAKLRASSNGYGGTTTVTNSAITARLKWNDGSEGIALCSVTNMRNVSQNMYSGAMQEVTTSFTSERSYIRFPAARRDEAERILVNTRSSIRTNSTWQQAVDGYCAQLGRQQEAEHRQRMAAIDAQTQANTAAHNQRMANIQAQGAASTAAYEQRMNGMDTQMRSWENQQASQDKQHTAFVQTIREVETWKDASGSPVEMSSGYDQAWSRGDGSYILSNKPGFDPSSVFQDQNWTEMKRVD